MLKIQIYLRLVLLLNLVFTINLVYGAPVRTFNKYDTEDAINTEFENVFNNLRNQTFRIIKSSPVYVATGTINIDNGELLIVSSGTYGALFFRANGNIFYQEFKKK